LLIVVVNNLVTEKKTEYDSEPQITNLTNARVGPKWLAFGLSIIRLYRSGFPGKRQYHRHLHAINLCGGCEHV